jgi:hypothetical protein
MNVQVCNEIIGKMEIIISTVIYLQERPSQFNESKFCVSKYKQLCSELNMKGLNMAFQAKIYNTQFLTLYRSAD